MKSYKKILPIFLSVALFGSAAYSIQTKSENANAYAVALEEARNYAAKGIEVDAMSCYQEALDIEPTLAIYLEAGEVYLENDDLSAAKKWYQNELLEQYPKAAETYLYGIKMYLASDNYRNAFSVYEAYQNRGLYLDEVENMIDPIRYMYTLSGRYEDVGVFSNVTNTAAVMYDGLWGYVNASGNRMITYDYVTAGTFGTYAAVTDVDGNAYYIDQSGDIKINEKFILETDSEFLTVKEFQGIQSNMILAYNGEIWNYYDADTYEKLFGGYKEATPITNGVGAVSEDGEKWELISTDGSQITDAVFDGVVADDKGIVCRSNAIVVILNGEYILVDHEGNQLGDGAYTEASAFYDGTYAACGNGQNWSFVDDNGNVVLTGKYQDARSFSNGLAAVKVDGKWGYIDISGEIVIPCEFEEAGPFNTTGVAFVKVADENWQLLSLYQYNHD